METNKKIHQILLELSKRRKKKREAMYKRVRWFKIHVTKVPEGKTVSPYLAITREYSVSQGKMRKKLSADGKLISIISAKEIYICWHHINPSQH